jgi:hypothetical protein
MIKEIVLSKYVGVNLAFKNLIIAILIIVSVLLSVAYVKQNSEISLLKVEIKTQQSSIGVLESRIDDLENNDYEDRISDLESRVEELENR